jgi:lysophospholipase L1-like esterase
MTKTGARGRAAGMCCSIFLAGVSGMALQAHAASGAPTVFIAGDSTASSYEPKPNRQQGWAAVLQPFFNEKKLHVVDAARGGRSSRTFISEGHWDKMLADVHKGDFVIIQFGHNDSGAVNQEPPGSTKPLRARGSIPGIGNESQEIDNVVTGKHETVYTFGWYLRKMIADTRAKGATPILLTTTRTNSWHDGRVDCPSDTYRLWTWQTSVNEKAAFVDLSRMAADRYQAEGPQAVTAQFIEDTVHSNIDGAVANAKNVVSGLVTLKGLPFKKMLSAAGKKIPADRGPPKNSVCPPLG